MQFNKLFNELINEVDGSKERKFEKRIKHIYDEIVGGVKKLENAGYTVKGDIKVGTIRKISNELVDGEDTDEGSTVQDFIVERDGKRMELSVWMWSPSKLKVTVYAEGDSGKLKHGGVNKEVNIDTDSIADAMLDSVVKFDK